MTEPGALGPTGRDRHPKAYLQEFSECRVSHSLRPRRTCRMFGPQEPLQFQPRPSPALLPPQWMAQCQEAVLPHPLSWSLESHTCKPRAGQAEASRQYEGHRNDSMRLSLLLSKLWGPHRSSKTQSDDSLLPAQPQRMSWIIQTLPLKPLPLYLSGYWSRIIFLKTKWKDPHRRRYSK